jgi:hypothetical protein
MLPEHPESFRSGRIAVKLMVLIVAFSVAILVLYYALSRVRGARECRTHLQQIYRALELYEVDRGVLPSMAFFPDDPRQDTDSLRVVLEAYGVDPASFVCPSMPDTLADLGLTYVWNVQLNGKRLHQEGEEPRWMLVEISALSIDVPAPHLKRYNVLFTDGTIQTMRYPLKELRGL